MSHILNSTGEKVYKINWIALTPCPWDQSKYSRVMMPNGGIQIIRNDKLSEIVAERNLRDGIKI